MAQMAQVALQGRKVTVNRLKLIDTLKENKEKHIQKFKDAISGYIETATEMVKEKFDVEILSAKGRLESTLKSISEFNPDDPSGTPCVWQVVRPVVANIPVPFNHSGMYQTAISMMEWDVREDVELTYSEFQCFVLDEWEWKSEFEMVTSSYVGKAKNFANL